MTPHSKAVFKEIAIIIFTVIATLLVTVFTTISGAGFDLSRLSAVEVYTNIILNAIIVTVVTVVALPYGRLNTMCRKTSDGKGGKYITAVTAFTQILNSVKHRFQEFTQWHTYKYEQELDDKRKRYLLNHGIKQIDEIMKLDRDQIKQLSTSQKFEINGEELFFYSLTWNQRRICLRLYDGKVKLHKLPDQYFMSVDGKSSSSFYEQAYYESLVENAYVISNILLKVLMSLVVSCVLTSLVVDTIVFDNTTLLKIFTNLISRILTIGLSLYSGYAIGQNLIYKKCYYIDGKTQILTEFNDDKSFVYQDSQVLAKQEYERSVTLDT